MSGDDHGLFSLTIIARHGAGACPKEGRCAPQQGHSLQPGWSYGQGCLGAPTSWKSWTLADWDGVGWLEGVAAAETLALV